MGMFGMTYSITEFRNDVKELERIIPLVKGMLKQADAGGMIIKGRLPVTNSVMQHNLDLMFEACQRIGNSKKLFQYK